jgi:hypothetical protein
VHDETRQPDPALERYLDGQLGEADRAAFERSLPDDPERAAQVALQAQIDDALGRLFEPPETVAVDLPLDSGSPGAPGIAPAPAVAPALNGVAATTTGRAARRRPRWRAVAALAAAIALAAVGAWQIRSALTAGRGGAAPYGGYQDFAGFYASAVAAGFEPQWVCADDAEFRRTFEEHYGQPLLLGELPPDVRTLGLSYAYSLSPRTTCLLARAAGEPVVVFVDEAHRDPGPQGVEAGGMNLFRRRLGRVVLYELTPLDEPRLLERFRDPTSAGSPRQ